MISLTSPIRTRAHDWPAGLKLAAMAIATFVLFLLSDIGLLLAALAGCVALYGVAGLVFLRAGISRLKPLVPFVAILALWHMVTATYLEGAIFILRLLAAFSLANLVTMTTPLSDMISVIRWLSSPLRLIGLNTKALEMAIALVIRILPRLIENGERLALAWRARSTKRPMWKLVIPFTLVTLDDAEHLSDALRARGGLEKK